MSFTLRQVQPLLTKPELELFQASRANAVKELTARQLMSRVTRTRALRDKYRDTFQRQTVQTRTGPAGARKQMGGENQRTEVKAEIMADVLQRFEAQHDKVQAKLAKQDAGTRRVRVPRAPGVPASKTNPKAAQRSRRSSGDAAPGEGADLPMRGASTTKPRQLARKERAAEAQALEVLSARGAQSSRASGSSVRPAVKAADKKTDAAKPARRLAPSKAITGAARPAEKLVRQVRDAVTAQQAATPVDGKPSPRRGSRTRVGGGASDNAQGAVPTNMPAVATRLNPLKAEPVNKKIHAAARGRNKAFEAKVDGR